MLQIDEHPSLSLIAFQTEFPSALEEMPSPDWLVEYLRDDVEAPIARTEESRKLSRDLLRQGGYKPTGRGKPASEYLVRAAGEGALASINLAVDACNVVSLHSGIPISVVDLDLAREPLRVGLADKDASYVFNATGQEISLGGLLCLHDADGPCANAVKDAQRTKTHAASRRTLSLLWLHSELAESGQRALDWYRELLERAGAKTELVRTGAGD